MTKNPETPKIDPVFPTDAWTKAARDNLEKLQRNMNAYWDELASFENAMYERARAASADLAALAAESIAYVSTLSAEWRKMSLDATRRMAETFKA